MPSNEKLLDELCSLAVTAGACILKDKARTSSVTYKSDSSPLTSADLASHEAIAFGLKEIAPEVPVVSEEGTLPPFAERKKWGRYFLVDPLDGTKEFVKGGNAYTVNIALVDGGVPVVGVVYVPELGALYAGAEGVGAFKKEGEGGRQRIHVASSCEPFPLVLGSSSHGSPEMGAFLAQLGEHELRRVGSSLKLCQIADGTAHIYPRFGPTSEWDTAAGHAVVLHAGGRVLQLGGEPLNYNQKADILNPAFFAIGPEDRPWLEMARRSLEA